MFEKILIANRGEIAVRIIRACKEMGISTVAVYSTIEKEQLFVKLADETVCIGEPPVQDSYLNIANIIQAAIGTGTEAIHPGYGFLSENADFAEKVEENGLVFIGPSGKTMRLMGDKIRAKQVAKKADVPIIPGSQGEVKSLSQAKTIASEIGYPILLKAANGGGGRGIRRVNGPDEIKQEWTLARKESMAAFGSPEIYIEKLILNPRHVEVQVLADKEGRVIHLYERDCSIQRRHQKIIEEAPSSILSEEMREEMCQAAVRITKECGYENAGTVEYLVDKEGKFYFIEMNARLQVEHPVTEMITGVDLVKQQIRIAAGYPLTFKQEEIQILGHAIECRINAEDPYNNFAPQPGELKIVHTPGGFNVRFDNALRNITKISSYYDSMIGKLIVKAASRQQALNKMKTSLEELVLGGLKTTIKVPYVILTDKRFQKGDYDTSFVDESLADLLEQDTILDHDDRFDYTDENGNIFKG